MSININDDDNCYNDDVDDDYDSNDNDDENLKQGANYPECMRYVCMLVYFSSKNHICHGECDISFWDVKQTFIHISCVQDN
jgi:hypothetical protein